MADGPAGEIFFQDDSGFEILETDFGSTALRAGQYIQLIGTNYVEPTEIGISLGRRPVVDNDGRHLEIEGVGTVSLKRGLYPIEVLWFNGKGPGALKVSYSGPGFSRRALPNRALFCIETGLGSKLINGVRYQCYDGDWLQLPEFDKMRPSETGIVPNFTLNAETRTNRAGTAFECLLAVDKDGPYTFYLDSEDGSRLFIHNTPIRILDLGPCDTSSPRIVVPGQRLKDNPETFWAQTEGVVRYLGVQDDGVQMDLESGNGPMRVVVLGGQNDAPNYLLGSRISVQGACLNTTNFTGGRSVDVFVVPNWKSVNVLETASSYWLSSRSLTVAEAKNVIESNAYEVVKIRGSLQTGTILQDETGSMPIDLLTSLRPANGEEIECLGRWYGAGSNSVLRDAVWRGIPHKSDLNSDVLPVLTTALQVQQLTHEDARRGYPVDIMGTVSWVSENHKSIVLNDSTRGVYVVVKPAWIWAAPMVGENLEIEGVTSAREFGSSYVILHKVKRLGMGSLPTPLQSTWDQLIGGSLDCQYVEMRGLITSIKDNHLFLLMPGGTLDVDFRPTPANYSQSLINAVVRIRGVIFVNWSHPNYQARVDRPFWIGNSTICIEALRPSILMMLTCSRQSNWLSSMLIAILFGAFASLEKFCITRAGFTMQPTTVLVLDFNYRSHSNSNRETMLRLWDWFSLEKHLL